MAFAPPVAPSTFDRRLLAWMYSDCNALAYHNPARWSHKKLFEPTIEEIRNHNTDFGRSLYVREYDGDSGKQIREYLALSMEQLYTLHLEQAEGQAPPTASMLGSFTQKAGLAARSAVSAGVEAASHVAKHAEGYIQGNEPAADSTSDDGLRAGVSWISIKRGDPIPHDAVEGGTIDKVQGRVFVGRVGGDAGFITQTDWKMASFFGHHSGERDEAYCLCCSSRLSTEWRNIKRGEEVPKEAVEAGQTSMDGVTLVGRFSGQDGKQEPGKINMDKGAMWKFWSHLNKDHLECQILLTLEVPNQCPQGHDLDDYILKTAGNCEGCKQRLDAGAHVKSCAPCRWKLCDTCFSNAETGLNAGKQTNFSANSASSNAPPRASMRPKSQAVASSRYAVCLDGTKCRNRVEDHLANFSHPFDPDYEFLCDKCGVAQEDREEQTLLGLFNWLDADLSGNLSTAEVEEGLGLLDRLQMEITEEADEEESPSKRKTSVEALDEDGNGCVGFSEFAQWAGPRLGLPLGVVLKRGSSKIKSGTAEIVETCGIKGCPCTNFTLDERKGKVNVWQKFKVALGTGDVDIAVNQCSCGHKKTAHVPTTLGLDGGSNFPSYWKNRSSEEDDLDLRNFQEFIPVSADVLPGLQKLLDATYKNVWTRDRRNHQPDPNVPRGFRVQNALRNEHKKPWMAYQWRKSLMEAANEEDSPATNAYGRIKQYKTKLDDWQKCEGAEELSADINEWYLFHGCNSFVAKRICETDFHIGSAGKNTGSLYGGGTYMGESITKADEYAKVDDRQQYAVLLCRALGGRVYYTDEVVPDSELLTQSCLAGPYDCVLGDREKCRNTFREFVFFDSDDMYPEYIIYYTRY